MILEKLKAILKHFSCILNFQFNSTVHRQVLHEHQEWHFDILFGGGRFVCMEILKYIHTMFVQCTGRRYSDLYI